MIKDTLGKKSHHTVKGRLKTSIFNINYTNYNKNYNNYNLIY